ncbi:ATP-binding cassette domain-containing protein [Alkalibaculum sp. M08DMB]|uniref:ATP-binding cassette domain-containing protein n=1 Tax=Alkalibaculum sporogenes TaxID=2655001 RepID=A0A6A7K5D7_9FIRM|nr:ABC transporter ATP-binding protein [Alkalibaculum sporogenes]MPW24477.1 ATP-binding cassette domain-containing protein [Alkalibaculum sporogenes]
MNILELTNVHKKLGKIEIIRGINLSIGEGEIFGFLGPNGAGKTTTIKMIVGLIQPDSGCINIAGKNTVKEGNEARSEIGAVVENPEMYNYLSGMANLKLIAEIRKIPMKNVHEVVEIVNLTERIGDKVGKYSLGMKQRLGLACALLSKPKLLILDEPTNGLDPSGIIDFRKIVKNAVKEMNTSVFISSHILSEVQQLCDTVAFINYGEIKAIESITKQSINNETETVSINISQTLEGLDLLRKIESVENVSQQESYYIVTAKKGSSAQIIKTLVENNIDVNEVFIKYDSLEQRYMELVEGGK